MTREFGVPAGDTIEELKRFLEDELRLIQASLADMDVLDLREIHAEPVRPRNGMIVFADGTDWNPGGGRGFYGYNNGWVRLTLDADPDTWDG
jgi:hypothetical protein